MASLITVALAASACAGSNNGEETAKPGARLKAADINQTARDKVKQGGTLRWAIDQFSTQWNYNQLNGPEDSTSRVIGALMPSLFTTDEKAVPAVNKDYLTSAEVTSRSPKQVVTYKINDRAAWSDGKPLTWLDFDAQWKALGGKNPAYQVASTTGYDQIESVKQGAGDREVVVTFAKPFSEWQSLFSPLYPVSANGNPVAFNTGWLNKIPVTAGSFKLEKIDQTSKTITTVPDPKWWGNPAKLDRIVFRAMEVDAAVNAFANGEVDLFNVGPDPDAYKRAQGVKDAQIREAAGPDFRHFTFNATSPLLSNVNVRRAVAMSINREAIARSDLQGLNWPAITLNNHFFVNTQEGYRDNSGDVGKFDPAKARKLLDEAGWKLSGQVRQKDGKPLELRFVIPSGIQLSKREGELVQAMLQDVGVKLTIQAVPSDTFFDKYVSTGDFDITPFSWIGTPFPISSARSIYINPTKDAKGQLQIQQNFARVGSPEIDKLMDQAIGELDLGKARDLLNQTDKAVWDEGHSLTLYQRPQIVAVKGTLANYGALGFKTVPYEDIGFTG